MQRRISIILILIFSTSLIASSALGFDDCGARCCCQTGRMGHAQVTHAMGAAAKVSFLKAAGCCSGSAATPCNFSNGSAQNLPEPSQILGCCQLPDVSGIGLTTLNIHIEDTQPKLYARGPDPWLKTKPLPIFLQNLAFLC